MEAMDPPLLLIEPVRSETVPWSVPVSSEGHLSVLPAQSSSQLQPSCSRRASSAQSCQAAAMVTLFCTLKGVLSMFMPSIVRWT